MALPHYPRDAGKTLTKRMNDFAQTMYLEQGVRMVVLGGWVDPEGKKKWSVYENYPTLPLVTDRVFQI